MLAWARPPLAPPLCRRTPPPVALAAGPSPPAASNTLVWGEAAAARGAGDREGNSLMDLSASFGWCLQASELEELEGVCRPEKKKKRRPAPLLRVRHILSSPLTARPPPSAPDSKLPLDGPPPRRVPGRALECDRLVHGPRGPRGDQESARDCVPVARMGDARQVRAEAQARGRRRARPVRAQDGGERCERGAPRRGNQAMPTPFNTPLPPSPPPIPSPHPLPPSPPPIQCVPDPLKSPHHHLTPPPDPPSYPSYLPPPPPPRTPTQSPSNPPPPL